MVVGPRIPVSGQRRIALGLKQLEGDPWSTDIPERYKPGAIVKGKVTKITNFGVFVELEEELEGLLHVSELADASDDNVGFLQVESNGQNTGVPRPYRLHCRSGSGMNGLEIVRYQEPGTQF